MPAYRGVERALQSWYHVLMDKEVLAEHLR